MRVLESISAFFLIAWELRCGKYSYSAYSRKNIYFPESPCFLNEKFKKIYYEVKCGWQTIQVKYAKLKSTLCCDSEFITYMLILISVRERKVHQISFKM